MAKFLALRNDSQSSQSSATVYDRLDLHVNEVRIKTNSFIVEVAFISRRCSAKHFS